MRQKQKVDGFPQTSGAKSEGSLVTGARESLSCLKDFISTELGNKIIPRLHSQNRKTVAPPRPRNPKWRWEWGG